MDPVSLPYGVGDLDPDVIVHPDDPDLVRCYVRGCRHFVRRPTRRQRGQSCPDHGIYCHHSGYGSTYRYADVRRNIIASPDLFAQRIVGHPFKFESHRLGSENSEDALSWNVFRSLQEAGCLAQVAELLIGESHAEQPRLYLWGIRVDDDSFEPWDLLIAARERFESHLPVQRPQTEPDIALHLPGRYLVLIEAKFTSPNPVYERGPRKDPQSLTLDELLDIYWDPTLRILDYEKAKRQPRIHYQLWRNMVFAEWMARLEGPATVAYHVNLVRATAAIGDSAAFKHLVRPRSKGRFSRRTWEAVQHSCLQHVKNSSHEFLSQKTANLRPAFLLFNESPTRVRLVSIKVTAPLSHELKHDS